MNQTKDKRIKFEWNVFKNLERLLNGGQEIWETTCETLTGVGR